MARSLVLLYGTACYGLFFATFLYLIGFLANFGVPVGMDAGERTSSVGLALVMDVALLALFAVQHSVMARPAFKTWLTRFVPVAAERSTYVLLSSLALIVLFVGWQPLPATVWEVRTPWLQNIGWGTFVLGIATVLYTTFLIDHFDLFGLRQVALYFRARDYTHRSFATPSLYRFVRHPLYVGWILTFWATPTMSVGHLLFATTMTAYIFLAIPLEERDLENSLGESYTRYRETTPMLVPNLRRSPTPNAGGTAH